MITLKHLIETKRFKQVILAVFIILSAFLWFGLWLYGQYYVSTDDAYVNANVVQISPRITGKITKLHIENNQYVKKDQLLFEIDPHPFQIAYDAAQAQVLINEATHEQAENNAKRTSALVKRNFSSPQEGENAITALKIATGNLQQSKAALDQANLNLQYTKIYAPENGWISNMSLREGDIITANQPLFALISDEYFWVDANYKETAVEKIKAGQKASITVDMYPSLTYEGVVESISSGTGAVFSLLPPENATGNWVKVTQRIPVRVRVKTIYAHAPLRIGASANVTIYLHS